MLQITRAFVDGLEAPLVLDIGANLGGYAIPVGKLLQSAKGTVHAFEPQRIVYYQLCGNIFLNSLDNVHASHLALGDSDDSVEIPVPEYARFTNIGGFSLSEEFRILNGTQPAMTPAREKVAMAKLDSLAFPRPVNFIKLDVEGFELQVLRGAREFLRAHRHPPICFEAWSESWFVSQKAALLDFVRGLGYGYEQLGAYDHLAQHPDHPVQVEVTRTPNGFGLRRKPR